MTVFPAGESFSMQDITETLYYYKNYFIKILTSFYRDETILEEITSTSLEHNSPLPNSPEDSRPLPPSPSPDDDRLLQSEVDIDRDLLSRNEASSETKDSSSSELN